MQTTREHILNLLKERGQVTVDELSRELGLTAVTVRHHIDILRSEGLVAAPLARRRKAPGRPQYVYTLTEKASTLFPKRYSHLVSQILDEVRAQSSPEKVEQMMMRIGESMANQATIPDDGDFKARLAATVKFLDGLGYMAQWEQGDDGGYLLHVANCPYERVSRQDSQVCTIDLAMLTRLLGTSLQRVTSPAQSDHHQCTYAI
ncbi:MAG: ArsR family transcriptional regulator, partial [Anaerolineae bacterium]